ncbi:helix-turn-helix domain-containing protein [Croceibacterium sp. TMG7-5b_MA50]|uniref:helix-turn-helix domain-containing protein n=1 Tax=Croceibacterium sp. TMG7-5b_MA50 TaxID=3121290 RepID=UPI003221EC10
MDGTQADGLLARMERAVALMTQRIAAGETPSLAELAAAAAFSPYHFHRAYRLVTGETPGETQRRLRAAHAAVRLRDTGSVTAIAHETGYGSSQALAKALRSLGAAPATELRRDPERLDAAFAVFAPPQADSTPPLLSIEACRTLPFEVLVSRHHGDPMKLNEVYTALFKQVGGPGGVAAILGMPLSDELFEEPPAQLHDAALRLTLDGRSALRKQALTPVQPGLFVTARAIGDLDGLPTVIDRVVALVLVSPDVELAGRPLLLHYLDDPEEVDPLAQRTDIYVPVVLVG